MERAVVTFLYRGTSAVFQILSILVGRVGHFGIKMLLCWMIGFSKAFARHGTNVSYIKAGGHDHEKIRKLLFFLWYELTVGGV